MYVIVLKSKLNSEIDFHYMEDAEPLWNSRSKNQITSTSFILHNHLTNSFENSIKILQTLFDICIKGSRIFRTCQIILRCGGQVSGWYNVKLRRSLGRLVSLRSICTCSYNSAAGKLHDISQLSPCLIPALTSFEWIYTTDSGATLSGAEHFRKIFIRMQKFMENVLSRW